MFPVRRSRSPTVRFAIPTEANAIAEIHVATWRSAYRGMMADEILDALNVSQRTEFWRGVLSTKHNILVALNKSSIVGFCSLIPSRDTDADSSKVAEIAALYVSPTNWRQGVGRALCERAFEHAIAKQFTAITLWVLASNNDAIRFYQAMGLTPDGTSKCERDSSGSTYTEIRMRRSIVSS